MLTTIRRVLTALAVVGLALFALFTAGQISVLADLAGRVDPRLGTAVFWTLSAAALVALALLLRPLLRPRALVPPENPSPEERERFLLRLSRRLARNRHLREAGIDPAGADGREAAFAELNARADAEIKRASTQIFVTTAISQNGRLDMLVVLFLLARLVWRVAKVYDQRPALRELLRVYLNVAGTALLAAGLEDVDLTDRVEALVGPVATGAGLGMVPGGASLAAAVTASVLDGTANALLALRVGLVARESFNYRDGSMPRPRRGAIAAEAGRMLLGISGDAVKKITRAFVRGARNAVRSGVRRTGEAVAGGVKHSARVVYGAASSPFTGGSRRESERKCGPDERKKTRPHTGSDAGKDAGTTAGTGGDSGAGTAPESGCEGKYGRWAFSRQAGPGGDRSGSGATNDGREDARATPERTTGIDGPAKGTSEVFIGSVRETVRVAVRTTVRETVRGAVRGAADGLTREIGRSATGAAGVNGTTPHTDRNAARQEPRRKSAQPETGSETPQRPAAEADAPNGTGRDEGRKPFWDAVRLGRQPGGRTDAEADGSTSKAARRDGDDEPGRARRLASRLLGRSRKS